MANINYTGHRIKEERKRLGMSQSDLAKQLNCVKTTVSRWETGVGYPDIETLEKLASVFNVSIDSLITEKKDYQYDNIIFELKNVTKTYQINKKTKVNAVKNINLSLGNKGMVFLLGKSGSGKTTLLNLIGSLDDTTDGELLFCGKNLSEMSKEQLDQYRNQHVAFVFQDYNVFDDLTVRQNISLALELQNKTEQNNEIQHLLEKFDLEEVIDRKTSTLSGGQKQRVAIARALIKNSKIVLADEPSGALDTASATQVFDCLKVLAENQLVVVVSHNRDLANTYADRIIELEKGRIISDTDSGNDVATCLEFPASRKSKLSAKTAFFLGIHALKRIKWRLALSLISTIIALATFNLADMFSNYNRNQAVADTMAAASINDFSIEKTYIKKTDDGFFEFRTESPLNLSQSDVSLLQQVDTNCIAIFNPSRQKHVLSCFANVTVFEGIHYTYMCQYYQPFISGFAEWTDTTSTLYPIYGKTPTSLSEIAIPLYIYEMFSIAGYRNGDEVFHKDSVDTIDKFLAIQPIVNINEKQYKIVGVVDTGFDRDRFQPSNVSHGNSATNRQTSIYQAYLEYNLHTVAFVKEGFFNAMSSSIIYLPDCVELSLFFEEYNRILSAYAVDSLSSLQEQDVVWQTESTKIVIPYSDIITLATSVGRDDILSMNDNVKTKEDRKQFAKNVLLPFINSMPRDINIVACGETLDIRSLKIDGIYLNGDDDGRWFVNEDFYALLTNYCGDYSRVYFQNSSGKQPINQVFDTNSLYTYAIKNHVSAVVDLEDQIFTAFGKIFFYVSIVALLLAIVFASNFISSSIFDKKGFIGILRALGASIGDICKIFLSQSGVMLSVAYTGSTILSAILWWATNEVVSRNAPMPIVMLNYGIRQIGISLAISILIWLISTITPTYFANRKKPFFLINNK